MGTLQIEFFWLLVKINVRRKDSANRNKKKKKKKKISRDALSTRPTCSIMYMTVCHIHYILIILLLISPLHGLYKIDYIKSFVAIVSRYLATSPINVTRLLPPPHARYDRFVVCQNTCILKMSKEYELGRCCLRDREVFF